MRGIHSIPLNSISLPRRKMGVSGGVGKTPPFHTKKKKRSPIMRRMQFVFAWAFPIPGSAQMDNEGEKHTYDGYFLCFITLHLNDFRKQTTRRNVKRAVTVNSVIKFYCNVNVR